MKQPNALTHLQGADETMAELIRTFGVIKFGPRPNDVTLLSSLIATIIYQAISVKSANAVYRRFLDLYPEHRFPTAKELLDTEIDTLRRVGLPKTKAAYIKTIAQQIASGALDEAQLAKASDEAIIDSLTSVKGIGIWTAQITLMFYFRRLDVLPSTDLGIKAAVGEQYRFEVLPSPKEVEAAGEPWRPYRTFASLYLWYSRGPEHIALLDSWLGAERP